MALDNSIEAQGLVREFKKGPRAVDGIDLRVEPGEIFGFLGPNGAGKSTTVLMLTTLLPPTAGTARVGGFDVIKQGPQVRKSIGAVQDGEDGGPLHASIVATLRAARQVPGGPSQVSLGPTGGYQYPREKKPSSASTSTMIRMIQRMPTFASVCGLPAETSVSA